MNKYLLISFLFLSPFLAVAQTEAERKILTEAMSSDKISITKQSITKVLSDPSHWYMIAKFNGILYPEDIFSSYKFFSNGLLLRSSPLDYRASDVDEGLWSFSSETKVLKMISERETLTFKVLLLNSVEMIIEDKVGNRFYFSAQTNLSKSPKALQWKINYTTLPDPKQLKVNWNIK